MRIKPLIRFSTRSFWPSITSLRGIASCSSLIAKGATKDDPECASMRELCYVVARSTCAQSSSSSTFSLDLIESLSIDRNRGLHLIET